MLEHLKRRHQIRVLVQGLGGEVQFKGEIGKCIAGTGAFDPGLGKIDAFRLGLGKRFRQLPSDRAFTAADIEDR